MDESISAATLQQMLGRFPPPVILDLRRQVSGETLPGALCRAADKIEEWPGDLEIGRPIVAFDEAGGETAREAVAMLRQRGLVATELAGGFAGWAERGLPVQPKAGSAPTLWVTRERPKIDRIACPWLIRRFVDPDARFLYVPAGEVLVVAASTGAVPYDIPGVTFSHRGDGCSFDAFIEHYQLDDPAQNRAAAGQMDHARAAEDRSHRVPLADPPLRRSGCCISFRRSF